MKIGLISDTHGNLDRTEQAAALFDREAVEPVVHCGDVGGLEILEIFAGRPFWFVWGNTDQPEPSWRRALEAWSMPWPEASPLRIELAGKRIIVAHGHEMTFRNVFRNPQADFLFYGHSHTRVVARAGGCTIVNPGAIQRTPLPTVAVIDLASGNVQHLDLQGRAVAVE